MVYLGEPVLNLALSADTIEDVFERERVSFSLRELDAVIGEGDVDRVRASFDQMTQELRRVHLAGLFIKLDEHELRCTVDGDKHIKLAVFGADFCDIDVKIADRV